MARADRIRVSLVDDAAGATALALPDRRMWPAALAVGVMFVIFAGVELATIARMTSGSVDNVSDLTFLLFEGFWVLGWTVGVVILGALTFVLLFYRESARLQHG